MTDDMRMMDAAINEEVLDEVNGGANTIEIDGVKILCRRHRVLQGETLSQLARDNNTTIKAIMKLNPIIKNKNDIRIGWVLRIPVNYKIY